LYSFQPVSHLVSEAVHSASDWHTLLKPII
jgi:hypothetical protein